MTKDEIIRMAREADILETDCYDNELEVEAFANLVAAAEREACARLCEHHVRYPSRLHFADAIRARGNT